MGPNPLSYAESRNRAISYFHKKVMKSDGCWIWIGYGNGRGYGKFQKGKYRYYAHRLSYEIEKGKIPKGKSILHMCDNPSCVNPNHLRLGTQKDNMEDCSKKGRTATPNSDLTAQDAIDMRNKYLEFKASLAKKYSLSIPQISNILNVRSWKSNLS